MAAIVRSALPAHCESTFEFANWKERYASTDRYRLGQGPRLARARWAREQQA